jgi:ADP-heptose:LPS heptosyltransferase
MPAASIVVFRPGALGDALLTVDALHALGERYPEHRIELVGHAQAGTLLASAGVVAAATPFDAPEVTGLFRIAPIVPERWASAAAAVLWLRDPAAVAAALQAAGVPRVIPAQPRDPGAGIHAADQLLGSLAPLGVAVGSPPAPLPFEVTAGGPRPSPGQLAIVHVGSGSARKNWPPDRFADLIHRLRGARLQVTLLAGPADADAVRLVRSALEIGPVAEIAPRTVVELASALGQAAVYIGNDSGPTHLSARLGVPTVAVFGPTDPAIWAPRGDQVAVVSRSPWPAVAEVWDAAQELLEPGSRLP